eukprot:s1162_g26.t1
MTAVLAALDSTCDLLKDFKCFQISNFSEVMTRPVHTRLAWFAGHAVLSSTCKIAVSQLNLTSESAHTFSQLPGTSVNRLFRESGSGASTTAYHPPNQQKVVLESPCAHMVACRLTCTAIRVSQDDCSACGSNFI